MYIYIYIYLRLISILHKKINWSLNFRATLHQWVISGFILAPETNLLLTVSCTKLSWERKETNFLFFFTPSSTSLSTDSRSLSFSLALGEEAWSSTASSELSSLNLSWGAFWLTSFAFDDGGAGVGLGGCLELGLCRVVFLLGLPGLYLLDSPVSLVCELLKTPLGAVSRRGCLSLLERCPGLWFGGNGRGGMKGRGGTAGVSVLVVWLDEGRLESTLPLLTKKKETRILCQ